MGIETKIADYKNYGKCMCITNGIIEVVVTVDCGPRVIRLGFVGKENFMFEDLERKICNKGEDFDTAFGAGSAWYIYGGHRLWLSPEEMPLTYYPDNGKVSYTEIENGVSFVPSAQKTNLVQHRLEITMCPDTPNLKVTHYATNNSEEPKEFSLWALSVLCKGGLEFFPQNDHDTGLLSNRNFTLWPYSDMTDPRVYWGKKYISLTQTTDCKGPFKVGTHNLKGWGAYLANGQMFIKRYTPNPKGRYPDVGCSFETYTNEHFLELETLGEFCYVTPGATLSHTEKWELVDQVEAPAKDDEEAFDRLVSQYIIK